MGQTKSRFRQFTDQQWERIEPLLPSNAGRQGHPFRDNRKIVEAIIYRYRAGIPWRDLPRDEYGAWQTVWKRHARYARDGTWDRILHVILADADAAGKIDWNVSVDATICRAHQHGTNTTRPDQDTGGQVESPRTDPSGTVNPQVANVVTGGQRNDGAMLAEVLADIHVPRLGRGRPRTRPDAVIADKAYSSGTIRRQLRSRGIAAVIPEKSDTIDARARRGRRGGRPPKLDVDLYRGRNVVERSFALAKQWRALATRYDKLAITYRAAVTLCAILTWLRHLGETP
uniref:IS5 family transposase n=1 Tax=Dietzia sp. oral taxon 368 TaxID=712270 RepID=UPI00352A0D17